MPTKGRPHITEFLSGTGVLMERLSYPSGKVYVRQKHTTAYVVKTTFQGHGPDKYVYCVRSSPDPGKATMFPTREVGSWDEGFALAKNNGYTNIVCLTECHHWNGTGWSLGKPTEIPMWSVVEKNVK